MPRYGPKAQEFVERQMHKLKHGGKDRPESRKQAIAIGLSEARRKGAKVPPPQKTKGR